MPRSSRSSARRFVGRSWGWLLLLGLLLGVSAASLLYVRLDRAPGELLRYAERRLVGHNKLEVMALPVIAWMRTYVERPVPSGLPTHGKGAQQQALPPVRYDGNKPIGIDAGAALATTTRAVASIDDLQRAMQSARPGDVIELLPGRYALQRTLGTSVAGKPGLPITVRAALPGRVELHSTAVEAFKVGHAYWVFENLAVVGICAEDDDCEHAFHVVGAARSTVLRNNRLINFNAQIKVNGERGEYPDDGLVQFNTLENQQPRQTVRPVTMVDLVAASGWTFADNLVANFHKAVGNGVSYGLFMKGGGSQGVIERNLVICSRHNISEKSASHGTGVRIGISLGGGNTPDVTCRNGRCDAEHIQGAIVNNVVAHCNDAGIDVNTSAQSTVAHNTLINTAGIGVRNAPASALVQANWLEGGIRVRDHGWLEAVDNETRALKRFIASPDALALEWTTGQVPTVASVTSVRTDFCQSLRADRSPPGAIGTDGPLCASAQVQPR